MIIHPVIHYTPRSDTIPLDHVAIPTRNDIAYNIIFIRINKHNFELGIDSITEVRSFIVPSILRQMIIYIKFAISKG